jgi:hypothetical protein
MKLLAVSIGRIASFNVTSPRQASIVNRHSS